MPPGRRPSRTHDEFVTAAIEFADEHGLDSLTLRDLGRAMGASATAIYRYFPDKESLFSAMRDLLLTASVAQVDLEAEPREVLVELAQGFRREARRHPCLSQLMIQTRLEGPAADAIPTLVGGALRRLGVPETSLALAYRQLESFVVGTTVFDFSGAPDHLNSRRRRLATASDLGFDVAYASEPSVDALNEQAFVASLEALVDAIDPRKGRKE